MKRIIKVVVGLMLSLALLLHIAFIYAFSHDFYLSQFDKLNVYENTDYPKEVVDEAAGELIKYIKGDRGDLFIVHENRSIFNIKEQYHMWDVKMLFSLLMRVRSYLALASLVLIITLWKWEHVLSVLKKTFYWSLGITGFLLIASASFGVAFEKFHKIFFSNDYWLFSFRKDFLVQMLVEDFFLRITIYIVLTYLVISFIALIVSVAGGKLNAKRIHGSGY